MKYKILIIVLIFFKCFVVYTQSIPEKLILRQSFIDTMHTQTREHIIIDSLSNYYNKFDYALLNEQQQDLVFILNFCDSIYKYDFVDLMANHSDLILVKALNVFQRVKCRTTLEKIENYRQIYDQNSSDFDKGEIPEILNEDSPIHDESEVTRIYQAVFDLEEWICMLPREKVLSIYYYIIDNKAFLYE